MKHDATSEDSSAVRQQKLSVWKVTLLSLIVCFLINLIAFGLRELMFKGELIELLLLLVVGLSGVLFIGIWKIRQRRSFGLSMIIGAVLTLLFWIFVVFLLSSEVT